MARLALLSPPTVEEVSILGGPPLRLQLAQVTAHHQTEASPAVFLVRLDPDMLASIVGFLLGQLRLLEPLKFRGPLKEFVKTDIPRGTDLLPMTIVLGTG